ncbi:response regulator [Salipaludibacillus sp. HK11]|uniref:response regulator n=1 Tax=Salipaludibacillus sp. HK11 TaxID=3394320 RepID=UPI0039FC77A9
MIKVLLVNNQICVVEGLKLLLEKNQTMSVEITTDSRNVIERIDEDDSDVIIFNLFMPYLNGLELSKQVLKKYPNKKILIFIEGDISIHFNLLIETGVCGFISKEASYESFVNTIECVVRGETVIPTVLFKQLRRTEPKVKLNTRSGLRDITLSEKEQRIILSISDGLTNHEIAEKLLVSQRSVEYTLTDIYSKLEVRSRAEALSKAKKYALITLQEIPSY